MAIKSFVWGNGLDELLAYYRWEGSSWVPYYPAQDDQGSIVAIHREDKTLVEEVEYDPYGKASVYVSGGQNPQGVSSVGNPYLFTGRRADPETGFVYLRNRYLHTSYGRFLSRDPIGSWADGTSLGNGYTYAANSPLTWTDPFGLSIAWWYDGPVNLPPGIMAAAGGGNGGEDPCHRGTVKIKTSYGWRDLDYWVSREYLESQGGETTARVEDLAIEGELVSGTLNITTQDGNVSATFTPDPAPRSLALDVLSTGLGIAAGFAGGPLGVVLATAALAASIGQGAYTGDYTDAAIDVGLSIAGFGIGKVVKRLKNAGKINFPDCCAAARGGTRATKGLQKQLDKHLKKLEDFKANPDKFDNKGFLKDASPELRQKIIDGRIRNLEKQIENFRNQINQAGGGG